MRHIQAYLCFNDWAGYREHPVWVVGETLKRYRITSDVHIKLPSGFLEPGGKALVPKTAVRFPRTEQDEPKEASE